MKTPRIARGRSQAVVAYASAACLSLLTLIGALHLWQADLHVPFVYGWDGNFEGMWVKSVLDNGWYLHNGFVGMPAGLDFHDWPMGHDNLHFAAIKLISLFTTDYPATLNLYYLFTFPLTTLTTLFALRRLGVSYGPGIMVSLLYTFLPYHFWRMLAGHIFLASYYMIPPMVAVILWVYTGEKVPVEGAGESSRQRLSMGSKRTLLSLAVCILVGSAGVYYAAYTCFFLLVAGLAAAWNQGRLLSLFRGLFLAGVIVTAVLVNVLPTLFYQLHNQANPMAVERNPHGGEFYPTKIAPMLLPVTGHRLSWFNRLKENYNNYPRTDADYNTLGLIGSIGFVCLLARYLFRRSSSTSPSFLDGLGLLTLAALLLGSAGGFGSVFCHLVTGMIRNYARIGIFIACFAMTAVALLANVVWLRWIVARPILASVGLAIITVLGLLDVTTSLLVPPYADLKARFESDAHYVQRIEASVPEHTMIFQLPYVPFPEHPPCVGMIDYDHFRGYLHSRTLRWSYGCMKGREWDLWQRELSRRPVTDMLKTLVLAGFGGVYVDRDGLVDGGAHLESALTQAVKVSPIVSEDRRRAFYSLADFARLFRQGFSDADWARQCEAVSQPILLMFGKGFFAEEILGNEFARWCSNAGQLSIMNTSDRTQPVVLHLMCRAGREGGQTLRFRGDLGDWDEWIDENGREISRQLVVSPGRHIIWLESDGKALSLAKRTNVYADFSFDPRRLVFNVRRCTLTVVEEEGPK